MIKYTKAKFNDSYYIGFEAPSFCLESQGPIISVRCRAVRRPQPARSLMLTPFWITPVAKPAEETMTIKRKKYTPTAKDS
jgi:hypothetical protein